MRYGGYAASELMTAAEFAELTMVEESAALGAGPVGAIAAGAAILGYLAYKS